MEFRSGLKDQQFEYIAQVPLSKIGQLGVGFAKVKGRITKANQIVYSPLTKTECVYFNVRVDEGSPVQALKTLVPNDTWCDNRLEISDETGTASVCLKGTEILVQSSIFLIPGTMMPKGFPQLKDVVRERYGVHKRGLFTHWCCHETVLRVGEVVFLLGDVEVGPDGIEFTNKSGVLLISNFDEPRLNRSLKFRTWMPLAKILFWCAVVAFIFFSILFNIIQNL